LTILAKNPRPVGAQAVTVSILLPPGLTLSSCAANKGGTCGGSPRNPIVTFARLGGAEQATISLTGLVACSATAGSSLPVIAQIAHSLTDPDPSNDIVTMPVSVLGRSAMDRMMGFEDVALWHSNTTPIALSSRAPTQGCYAIDVPGLGYRTLITTSAFSTPLPGTTDKLALDVFIPSGQPNPYWLGAIQMYASCPSANMNNAYIGQVELTGKPIGAYSTLSFPVPSYIRGTLGGVHPDCNFSIAVNMNQAPTAVTIDNLRFTP
jgi:hypothetical protein